jgi:DNA repair protein SbcD/Mre11
MKFVHTADTHLGYEILKVAWPDEDGRTRRAATITRNFQQVVEHTRLVGADLLLHAGDLFNKYYFSAQQCAEQVSPLIQLARDGVPVVIIPGNHERSSLPFDLFHGVPNIHVFSEPNFVVLNLAGYRVGIAGFPFLRNDSRRLFLNALAATGYRRQRTDFNILLVHQAFDSAVVGPRDFMFTTRRSDTVNRADIPAAFHYVAAGHIHRYQILMHPLYPGHQIVYPGSIQRMSFAEIEEDKGFIEAETVDSSIITTLRPLPAYPMERVVIQAGHRPVEEVVEEIRAQFWRAHDDLVLRFFLTGGRRVSDYPALDYARLRQEIPQVLECQFLVDCVRKNELR